MTSTAPVDEERRPLIIGGGPAGCCLALQLAAQGRACVLLEAAALDQPAGGTIARRTLALAQASWDQLGRLGITPEEVDARPIRDIHVSFRGRPGSGVLRASESGLSAFGQTVSYAHLLQALRQRLLACTAVHSHGQARVERVEGAASAARVSWQAADGARHVRLTPLALITDGGDRQPDRGTLHWHYRQAALACQLDVSGGGSGTAWERFTPEGPIALLPSGQGLALIWTGPDRRIRRLMQASEADFLAELQAWFGDRAGRFLRAGPRTRYPLQGQMVLQPAARRVIRLANAAQTLHPVAGQGFNLGLRDIDALCRVLADQPPGQDPGRAAVLDQYRRTRRQDRWLTGAVTHWLAAGFTLPGIGWPAAAVLGALDLSATLRGRVADLMANGAAA